eukprot:152200-Prymnesium_polylepis.1
MVRRLRPPLLPPQRLWRRGATAGSFSSGMALTVVSPAPPVPPPVSLAMCRAAPALLLDCCRLRRSAGCLHVGSAVIAVVVAVVPVVVVVVVRPQDCVAHKRDAKLNL